MKELDYNFQYEPRLKKLFREVVFPKMKEILGYKNDFAVPKIEQIVITCLPGKMFKDAVIMETAEKDLTLITGMKPAYILAKNSVAGFNLRQGMKLGFKVNLRGDRMYDFLDRLINAALPQQRNFTGFYNTSFDGRGNFSLGFSDYSVFPEIEYRKNAIGCGITIITTAQKDNDSQTLLEFMGIPFVVNQRKLDFFGQDLYTPQPEELFDSVLKIEKPKKTYLKEESVTEKETTTKKKTEKQKTVKVGEKNVE